MARRQMLEVHEDIGSLLRIIADPKQAQARFEQYKSYLAQMTAAAQQAEDAQRNLDAQLTAKSADLAEREKSLRIAEKEFAAAKAEFAQEREKKQQQITDRIASLEKREKDLDAHARVVTQREKDADKKLRLLEQREAEVRVQHAQAAEARDAAEQARNEVEARLSKIRALGAAVAA